MKIAHEVDEVHKVVDIIDEEVHVDIDCTVGIPSGTKICSEYFVLFSVPK